MYEKTEYQSMYEYLHNLSDIINSCNELIIVKQIDENTGNKIEKDLETKITKLHDATEKFYNKLKDKTPSGTSTPVSTNETNETKNKLETLKTNLKSLTKEEEKLKELTILKNNLKEKIEETIKPKKKRKYRCEQWKLR